MMPAPEPPAEHHPAAKSWLELAGPILALVVAAIDFAKELRNPSPLPPGPVLGLLPLLAVVAWLSWRIATGRRPFRRDRRSLLFLACYVAVFTVAAGSRLLDRRPELIGYEDALPANWLGLNRLGDWHYGLAPRSHPPLRVMVVIVPPTSHLNADRLELARLIALARDAGAIGLAFDFFFEAQSDPDLDAFLCEQVDQAWARKPPMPIFAGYRHEVFHGWPFPVPLAATLQPCFTDDRLGHLAVYLEPDDRVRMVPLALGGDPTRPSLDYRIAKAICPADLRLAANRPLQFVEPQGLQGSAVAGADLWRHPTLARGRFLLIGQDSLRDRFDTPFGRRFGVVLHANAVQALCDDQAIQHLDWWWTLPIIVISCSVAAALSVAGASVKTQLLAAGGATLAILALACVAMRWLVWVDVSYPFAALWVLIAILLAAHLRTPPGGARISRLTGWIRAGFTRLFALAPLRPTPSTRKDTLRGEMTSPAEEITAPER
jgi:CHASE2 domain-containing protein